MKQSGDVCPGPSSWTRFLVRSTERKRTTWLLRLGVAAAIVTAGWMASGWWPAAVAGGLVCNADSVPSDALLIDNLDADYLLFERAREVRPLGYKRILVPIYCDRDGSRPNLVATGIAEVMAKIARLGDFEVVPIRLIEPITLNAAKDIERYLAVNQIRSVTVVTPAFRSRRAMLVYRQVFGASGTTVRCLPVQGSHGATDWHRTWHGLQNVAEQWLKLLYYRLLVLPTASP